MSGRLSMKKNKWKFAEPDPHETPYGKIEYGGMMVVLGIGLILFAGGLFFAWKIGAFDINGFFGKNRSYSPRTEAEILCLLHAPWVAGAWMSCAAINYFRKKK